MISHFIPATRAELDNLARNHFRNQNPNLWPDGPIERDLYECSKCTRDSEIKCSHRCRCQCRSRHPIGGLTAELAASLNARIDEVLDLRARLEKAVCLDRRELATVLAALRLLQQKGVNRNLVARLSNAEIDALCKRINR